MPPDLGPSTIEPPSDADASSEIPWLQPFPDHLIEHLASNELEPDVAVVSRETIELAYVAAIQHLPPRPRAILILRDALDWSAKETADLLECQLRRSTARCCERGPRCARACRHQPSAPFADASRDERAVLARYMDAHDRRDEVGLDGALARGRQTAHATAPRLVRRPRDGHAHGRPRLRPSVWAAAGRPDRRQPSAGGCLVPASPGRARVPRACARRAAIELGQIAEITTFASPELFSYFRFAADAA